MGNDDDRLRRLRYTVRRYVLDAAWLFIGAMLGASYGEIVWMAAGAAALVIALMFVALLTMDSWRSRGRE